MHCLEVCACSVLKNPFDDVVYKEMYDCTWKTNPLSIDFNRGKSPDHL